MSKCYFGFVLCILAQPLFGQPSYYNSRQYQTNEYKSLSSATQRAYSVPDRPYSSSQSSGTSSSSNYSRPSSGSTINITPATGTGSRSYTNIGGDDRIRRQQEAARQSEERYKANMAALASEEAKYRQLIKGHGNAKTDADHYDLLLQGMRAGSDLTAVFRVIGRDLAGYHALWGNNPNVPYKSSADRMWDAQVQSLVTEANKLMLSDKSLSTRYAMRKEIAKVQSTVPNNLLWAEAAMAFYKYSDAAEAYRHATIDDPKNFTALSGWGDALLMQEDAIEAEKKYAEALELTSNNAELLLKIAWVTFIQKRYEDTYELARHAATLIPLDAGPYLILAALQPAGKERDELLTSASLGDNKLAKASLTEMLVTYSKMLQANGATLISPFYLDLALYNDPKNIDIVELRYGTNKKLNRQKAAAADEKLLEEL